MRVLDLFSGIGGFSLGFKAAGFDVLAHAEIEAYPAAVLSAVWPKVPNLGDVRMMKYDGTVDVVCGGFPCQDISLANSGSMVGLEGSRSGLWSEFFKQIQRHNPTFAVIENSPVLRTKGLDRILSELCEIGYDAEWHCIPATAVDAPHSRDRVWVIAYPAGIGDRLPEGQVLTGRHFIEYAPGWKAEPGICRVADGVPDQSHRLKALGNAVVPDIAFVIGKAIMEASKFTNQ